MVTASDLSKFQRDLHCRHFLFVQNAGKLGKRKVSQQSLTNLHRGKNSGDDLAITGEGTLMGKYSLLERCRVSGSKTLVPVLDLGEQALTGVFPRSTAEKVTTGPLQLVWCPNSGLLQLGHSYDAVEMYGENYGYRSGLNQSMVRHLTQKVRELERSVDLQPGDTVLDIGSNDATSLKAYNVPGLRRVGIDPTAAKFRQYYPDDVALVPDFFSAELFFRSGL